MLMRLEAPLLTFIVALLFKDSLALSVVYCVCAIVCIASGGVIMYRLRHTQQRWMGLVSGIIWFIVASFFMFLWFASH